MENVVKIDAAAKKAEAEAKTNHDLHVLLVMKQDNVSKSKALLTAYREDKAGLNKRLGK